VCVCVWMRAGRRVWCADASMGLLGTKL
jgi:hypothetical protein